MALSHHQSRYTAVTIMHLVVYICSSLYAIHHFAPLSYSTIISNNLSPKVRVDSPVVEVEYTTACSTSVATQQSESQMADLSAGAVRRLSPPTSIGSSLDSNYRERTASPPGTLSSSPAPPPPSTPLGSSEDYSTGPLSVFGLAN